MREQHRWSIGLGVAVVLVLATWLGLRSSHKHGEEQGAVIVGAHLISPHDAQYEDTSYQEPHVSDADRTTLPSIDFDYIEFMDGGGGPWSGLQLRLNRDAGSLAVGHNRAFFCDPVWPLVCDNNGRLDSSMLAEGDQIIARLSNDSLYLVQIGIPSSVYVIPRIRSILINLTGVAVSDAFDLILVHRDSALFDMEEILRKPDAAAGIADRVCLEVIDRNVQNVAVAVSIVQFTAAQRSQTTALLPGLYDADANRLPLGTALETHTIEVGENDVVEIRVRFLKTICLVRESGSAIQSVNDVRLVVEGAEQFELPMRWASQAGKLVAEMPAERPNDPFLRYRIRAVLSSGQILESQAQ